MQLRERFSRSGAGAWARLALYMSSVSVSYRSRVDFAARSVAWKDGGDARVPRAMLSRLRPWSSSLDRGVERQRVRSQSPGPGPAAVQYAPEAGSRN